MTWTELYDGARNLARGLSWLGIHPGDRIGIFLPNGPAWDIAQFGILWAGGIVVGLDPSSPPGTTSEIARRSRCVGIILENIDDISPWDRDAVAGLSWILTEHSRGDEGGGSPRVMTREQLSELTKNTPVPSLDRVRPEDFAALIFSSGTTGKPKGMLYTHEQFSIVRRTLAQAYSRGFTAKGLALSWLPLSNLFQRIFNLVLMEKDIPYHYVANPKDIATILARDKPTLFIGVPRFFEKARQGVLSGFPRPIRWILGGALRFSQTVHARQRTGTRARPWDQPLLWVLDVLLFRRIRRGWGGRLQLLISGSAPVSTEVLQFFEGIGIPIYESYGVSEILMPVAGNTRHVHRLGSVGKPFPGQEVRLSAEGEVLVRGPALHAGEDSDSPLVSSDGFYATGDLGRFDEDGFLYLVGRRSEVIKTSHGRRIALPQIEAHFRTIPGIDQVVVFGHGRPTLVALLTLAPGVSQDPEQLADLFRERNRLRPRHERISALWVLSKTLSPVTGELTPNLKLRRAEIERRHGPALEALYAELARGEREHNILVRFERHPGDSHDAKR